MKKTVLKNLFLIFKGIIVGFGAIMPGISGGTLCVAFGMYKPLLNVLSHPVKALMEDGVKLTFFLLGAGLGFVGLSGLAGWLMSVNSIAVTCVFIGFIVGTLPDLWHDAGKKGRSNSSFIALISGFVFLILILFFLKNGTDLKLKDNFIGFLICGVMWGLSFVVPGLSSSTLIIFLGLYQPMLEGISKLSLSVIIPIGIGVLFCLLSLSKAINHIFEKYYSISSHTIIGIVVASMIMVIPSQVFTAWSYLLTGILSVISGIVISYFASKLCNKLVN